MDVDVGWGGGGEEEGGVGGGGGLTPKYLKFSIAFDYNYFKVIELAYQKECFLSVNIGIRIIYDININYNIKYCDIYYYKSHSTMKSLKTNKHVNVIILQNNINGQGRR